MKLGEPNREYDCLLGKPGGKKVVTILSADWHLSDRTQDEYRWSIFDFLENLIKKRQAKYLIFAGDLCEAKDKHSARLINRILSNLRRLARALTVNSDSPASIFAIKGNHDEYGSQPFFKFLHRWFHGRVFYFTKPAEIGLWKQNFLFLPFSKNFNHYAAQYDFANYDRIIIHQPVRGAITENGTPMVDGISLGKLKKAGMVIGGDQHCPQSMGDNFMYVGSPYPVRFGDSYKPRVLVETDGVFESVPVPSIRKEIVEVQSLEDFEELGLKEGDQAKVTVKIPRSQFSDWRTISESIQRRADKAGVWLASLRLAEKIQRVRFNPEIRQEEKSTTKTPEAVLKQYAEDRKIGQDWLPFAQELIGG